MFSLNLSELRKINKITQKQLADKLGVSHKTVSHWEKGYTEPSLGQLKEIKILFNVSYEDLLD